MSVRLARAQGRQGVKQASMVKGRTTLSSRVQGRLNEPVKGILVCHGKGTRRRGHIEDGHARSDDRAARRRRREGHCAASPGTAPRARRRRALRDCSAERLPSEDEEEREEAVSESEEEDED